MLTEKNLTNQDANFALRGGDTLDHSASFAVDKVPNYQDINFESEDDNDIQLELFNSVKNLDKARKLQQKEKGEADLEVDAKLIDQWVANVDKVVYLADICERDGSLDPDNLDNILVNVFKMKQLTEHVRLNSDYVVKYGVAGISVPFSSLYSSINDAIEYVKAGLASDKRLQTAISTMFVANKSLITTDNDTGLKVTDIISFSDEDAKINDSFNIEKKTIANSKTLVISDMLDVIDIAGSLFVIDKAVLTIDSDALVISDNYKRTVAFKDMCAIIASMMIMFIDDDSIDFSLLDRML